MDIEKDRVDFVHTSSTTTYTCACKCGCGREVARIHEVGREAANLNWCAGCRRRGHRDALAGKIYG